MTETDIRFEQLPEAVKTAFQNSEYKDWRVDDVDKLEREGVETVYVIEVEGVENDRQVEYDLYYSPDGVLTKKVADAPEDYDYGDYIPSKPVSGVDNYLQTNYPDARILDIDYEGGMTEVEILDGRICRELLFDGTGNWIYTKTEVRRSEVPAAVSSALAASEYKDYYIDDIDHYQSAAEGEYYRFDLESRNGDVKVNITPDGTLTATPERVTVRRSTLRQPSLSQTSTREPWYWKKITTTDFWRWRYGMRTVRKRFASTGPESGSALSGIYGMANCRRTWRKP